MLHHRRWPAALVAGAAASVLLWLHPDPALASYPHIVAEGETLSGIAAANGMSTDTLASFNGISADSLVIIGQTVNIPSSSELGTTSTATSAHTVTEGETLSGIAAANGVSTDTLASFNGISADSLVIIGQTVNIPSSSGLTTTTTSTATTSTPVDTSSGPPATVPPSWVSEIHSPLGTAYLASNAAANWEAMRQASLATYGIDLYPAGPLSAFRTYDQQSYLYNLYLQGLGAPANPPGTSSHEYGTAVDLASPEMRTVVDNIGATYGWGKIHGPGEWWHVDYYGG